MCRVAPPTAKSHWFKVRVGSPGTDWDWTHVGNHVIFLVENFLHFSSNKLLHMSPIEFQKRSRQYLEVRHFNINISHEVIGLVCNQLQWYRHWYYVGFKDILCHRTIYITMPKIYDKCFSLLKFSLFVWGATIWGLDFLIPSWISFKNLVLCFGDGPVNFFIIYKRLN